MTLRVIRSDAEGANVRRMESGWLVCASERAVACRTAHDVLDVLGGFLGVDGVDGGRWRYQREPEDGVYSVAKVTNGYVYGQVEVMPPQQDVAFTPRELLTRVASWMGHVPQGESDARVSVEAPTPTSRAATPLGGCDSDAADQGSAADP